MSIYQTTRKYSGIGWDDTLVVLGSTTLLRAARFAGQDVQEPNRDASVRYVYPLGSS